MENLYQEIEEYPYIELIEDRRQLYEILDRFKSSEKTVKQPRPHSSLSSHQSSFIRTVPSQQSIETVKSSKRQIGTVQGKRGKSMLVEMQIAVANEGSPAYEYGQPTQ